MRLPSWGLGWIDGNWARKQKSGGVRTTLRCPLATICIDSCTEGGEKFDADGASSVQGDGAIDLGMAEGKEGRSLRPRKRAWSRVGDRGSLRLA